MELPFEEGLGLRALGMAQQARGRSDEAVEAFEQSCTLLEDDRYELARTKLSWGICLLDTSEKDHRIALFREARKVFRQLGAQQELKLVEALLKGFSSI
jgi:tetratricopeptide (TPR) repeat protein